MSPGEMLCHVRRRCFQFADQARERDWSQSRIEPGRLFPVLPERTKAPSALKGALARDVEAILAGHGKAFGNLDLKVDDPPRWHCDYLAGQDLRTTESAFRLNHRLLPQKADIKAVWELSRWYSVVRLAQAGWVLEKEEAALKCIRWLEDWVAHNPPYRGWNWTSALESGLRLVQFTWIDALLSPGAERGGFEAELETLHYELLPAHVWFTWRYRSFGSSANNHLIGELAGLILAMVRWPALEKWCAPLEGLQALWEKEVLAQFAEDGGNREQALNYHLFSWEFCWQARCALCAAGRRISAEVEERLEASARFFWEVQASREPWDYGDSDNAFVTPLFASEAGVVQEWREWMEGAPKESAIGFWLGGPLRSNARLGSGPPAKTVETNEGWRVYPHTGIALQECGFWWLRWDLSPLGYLKPAAHGHLDALHLSIWFKRMAVVVDPGTGAYYSDPELRSWLASRQAHNGPCPFGEEFPKRLGPFLWSAHHAVPEWREVLRGVSAGQALPGGILHRVITRVETGDGWRVADSFEPAAGNADEFAVHWQFAPGTRVRMLGKRRFAVERSGVSVTILVGDEWEQVELIGERPDENRMGPGMVSPAFRQVTWAPYLKLRGGRGEKPCLFHTTFLGSGAS